MKELNTSHVRDNVATQFCFEGTPVDISRFGNGHINDTFIVTVDCEGEKALYVLQRINSNVFKDPSAVMGNIWNVTEHIGNKLAQTGGDVERGVMKFCKTKNGEGFLSDKDGSFWRMYKYIDRSISLDLPETKEDFYESAYAFGAFQKMLSDFPAETLHETIADFHNTPDRFKKFLKAIEENKSGRKDQVEKEISFVLEREAFTHVLTDALSKGDIPLRVTHNDTKMNNVLLDEDTRKQVCVIDLDTIMPGLSVTDFGDSIRFGASTAAEDEKDLNKVHFDISLFEVYLEGFLKGCGGQLTANEIEFLPEGAKMMTLECGMRFLTDFLDGDTYFRTHYPEHNLDRCRTQFKLVSEMEEKWDDMKALVRKYK